MELQVRAVERFTTIVQDSVHTASCLRHHFICSLTQNLLQLNTNVVVVCTEMENGVSGAEEGSPEKAERVKQRDRDDSDDDSEGAGHRRRRERSPSRDRDSRDDDTGRSASMSQPKKAPCFLHFRQ